MNIDSLAKFFIDEKKINNLSKDCDLLVKVNKNPTTNKELIETKAYHFKIPKENDKLLWVYFIITNGEISYQMHENKNIVVEKNIKIDLVHKIRENKNILKQYKYAPFAELESNLSNDKYLSLTTFFSLMVLENKNIIYLKKKCFYKCLMNDSDIIYLINDKHGICEIDRKQLDKINEENLEINSLTKPIKSITSYKLDELKYMTNVLNIKCNEKKNKKDFYEEIVLYFSNF